MTQDFDRKTWRHESSWET